MQPAVDRMSTFHSARKSYDDLVRRDVKIDLPEEVKGSQDPLEYQSANLEKDIYDHVGILRMNPTRFDAIVRDASANAKKLEKRLSPWLARGWAEENPNRWWDSAVGEGQVRHGVKCMWYRVRPKPGTRWPFYWSNCNIYGCFWTEDANEPDAFWYKITKPVIEAHGDFKDKKKRVTLNTLGDIGWLGEDEEHDKGATNGKSVDIIVRDARDPKGTMCPIPDCRHGEHPQRIITVYVCPSGKPDGAEYVEEYPSPFPGCSFFVVGGNVSYHETDPHQKYRPMMLPAYNEQYVQSYLKTLIMTASRKAAGDQDIYADASSVPPGQKMIEGGAPMISVETEGSSPIEIPILPHLERWPKSLDPHAMTMLEESNKVMAEYRPNRFQTGTAFTEASNATGTAYLAGLQQSGMAYNGFLANSDAAIKKSREYAIHAMIYFGLADNPEFEGMGSEYSVVYTGEDHTYRYTKEHRPGDMLTISADELKEYDIDIFLKTSSSTKAEESADWLMAWDKYDKGVYTVEDLMKAAGIFDTTAQEIALFAQAIRQDIQPTIRQLAERLMLHRASARTGQDFGPSPEMTGAPPSSNGQDSSLGENNIMVPPNAQMGRSAQQLEVAASGAQPQYGGGSSPI